MSLESSQETSQDISVEDVTSNLEGGAGHVASNREAARDLVELMFRLGSSNESLDDVNRFLDRLKREKNEGYADAIYRASIDVWMLTMQEHRDVLGEVYMRLGNGGGNLGQNFTPNPVAKLLSELSIKESEIKMEGGDGKRSVADPACGSGRLLLAAGEKLGRGNVKLYGVDKDQVCASMTAINLFLLGYPGLVIHGDSLSLTQFAAWKIEDGQIKELDGDTNYLKKFLEAAKKN